MSSHPPLFYVPQLYSLWRNYKVNIGLGCVVSDATCTRGSSTLCMKCIVVYWLFEVVMTSYIISYNLAS